MNMIWFQNLKYFDSYVVSTIVKAANLNMWSSCMHWSSDGRFIWFSKLPYCSGGNSLVLRTPHGNLKQGAPCVALLAAVAPIHIFSPKNCFVVRILHLGMFVLHWKLCDYYRFFFYLPFAIFCSLASVSWSLWTVTSSGWVVDQLLVAGLLQIMFSWNRAKMIQPVLICSDRRLAGRLPCAGQICIQYHMNRIVYLTESEN